MERSCLSPALFSLYMDELLQELRKAGVGCYIGGIFAGAGSYCDDLVLLSPTRTALQAQMTICKNYAKKYNLTFSTNQNPQKSKTKCLLFSHNKREEEPSPVYLNDTPLFWVKQAEHLGHMLSDSGSQDKDCAMKRAAYIGETTELLGIFKHANPLQKLSAIQTYACSFYGSNLWDLYGPAANKVYKAWQVSIRDAWGLPRQTRTYLVDNLLSGTLSNVRQLILRRYVKFVNNLFNSKNPVISTLAFWATRTLQSTTGKMLQTLENNLLTH